MTESKTVQSTTTPTTTVIHLQDLVLIPHEKSDEKVDIDIGERWKDRKCRCKYDYRTGLKSCTCRVLTYKENAEATMKVYGNPIYAMFVNAYNHHEDIILSPDDIMLHIRLCFAKYINNNAEKMRQFFVEHEGKKKLVVTTGVGVPESEWEQFFELMIKAIGQNVKPGVLEDMTFNFSTTGSVERILSQAVVMDSFQKFFDYGRCIPCCGIANVEFHGSLEDWQMVHKKTLELKKYAVSPFWTNYIDKLTPVLLQFIDTFQNKVDLRFWNRIMNFRDGTIGSGYTTYISGWILDLLGVEDTGRITVGDIPEMHIDVPIEVVNHVTGIKKTVTLVGGFGGLVKIGNGYKPQMSFAILHPSDSPADSLFSSFETLKL